MLSEECNGINEKVQACNNDLCEKWSGWTKVGTCSGRCGTQGRIRIFRYNAVWKSKILPKMWLVVPFKRLSYFVFRWSSETTAKSKINGVFLNLLF